MSVVSNIYLSRPIYDQALLSVEQKKHTPGGRASRLGRIHENGIIASLDYFNLDYKRQQHICDSIYGSKLKTDFVVQGIPRFPEGIAIESKYQGSSGSADEKFPYLVANIKENFPIPCLILYSLDGAKPKSVEWLVSQKDGVKLIAILKYDKFPLWLHEELCPYD